MEEFGSARVELTVHIHIPIGMTPVRKMNIQVKTTNTMNGGQIMELDTPIPRIDRMGLEPDTPIPPMNGGQIMELGTPIPRIERMGLEPDTLTPQ